LPQRSRPSRSAQWQVALAAQAPASESEIRQAFFDRTLLLSRGQELTFFANGGYVFGKNPLALQGVYSSFAP